MHPADLWFPRKLAEEIRQEHPSLWQRHGTGGNPPTRWTGDDAYRAWGWLILLANGQRIPEQDVPAARAAYAKLTDSEWRGPTSKLFAEVVNLWLNKRENYITRHQSDFRPGGTIAMIKWAGIFPWAEEQAPGRGHHIMRDAFSTAREQASR